MGAGGVPNRNIEVIYGRYGDLPVRGAKPNSRYDLYVDGKMVQCRWFDAYGKVVRNRDYEHQNAHNNHKFPHDHIWFWDKGKPIRSKDGYEPDYKNYN